MINPLMYAKINGIVSLRFSEPKYSINNKIFNGYPFVLSLGLFQLQSKTKICFQSNDSEPNQKYWKYLLQNYEIFSKYEFQMNTIGETKNPKPNRFNIV